MRFCRLVCVRVLLLYVCVGVCVGVDLPPLDLLRWTPLGWTPKISLFFPSPATFSFFSPSLVGPFVEIWWSYERPGLQKHHQFSTKGPTREGEKNENCGGRGKKERNFGPHPSGPHFFQVWASTLRGPKQPLGSKNSTSKNWPKSKLDEVEIGRSRKKKKSWPKSKLAEVDRAHVGHLRKLQKAQSDRDLRRNMKFDTVEAKQCCASVVNERPPHKEKTIQAGHQVL